jgi:sugar lactone lactonase YvrE
VPERALESRTSGGMRGLRRVLAGVAVLTAAYFLMWPVPIEPRSWRASAFRGYAGAHAPNNRLARLRRVSIEPHIGPEHIEVGPDGKLYTGVLSGAILRMNPDGSGVEVVANTGGRPLGLAFDAGGRLIVADAFRGLVTVRDGAVSVLLDEYQGKPIRYADAVVIAPDGGVLFTDASQRMAPREHGTFVAALLDIMEHSCTGRVLRHDPVSGRTELVMEGLCFPNGLVLSRDARHLFVAETGEYRIWRIDAAARGIDARSASRSAAARSARVIASNLPGFPDNLSRGDTGRIWVGLTKPRGSTIDALAGLPFLRKVALRLPRFLWPVPPSHGHLIAYDEEGRVLADLQDPSGGLPETSGATEYHNRLYVQSLHAGAFGILDGAAAQ